MTEPAADSVDTETLAYLWTSQLDPLFWREGRAGVLSAWYGHIPFAHWIVAVLKPGIVVELGTQNGVSYSAFCEAVVRSGLDTHCFAVDTWRGDDQAGHYGEEVYLDLRRFHDGRYGAFSELLRCTFDQALPYIPDASVDLLHIDGLHTYEAVRHDFENWRPKLSDRAVVLFHDTNVREREFGVWRLWKELRTQFPSFEFLHGHGLGVLAVGQSTSPQVATLCSLTDSAQVSATRQRFSLLGERWTLLYRGEQLQEQIGACHTRIQSLEGEVAARNARLQSLENEVVARDARVQSLEAEIAVRDARVQSLDSEVTARDALIRSLEAELATEKQLRAQAAQRARQARAEAASARARTAEAQAQTITAPFILPAPTNSRQQADKLNIVQSLSRELAVFLASAHRLSFPAVKAPDVSVIVVLFNQAHFTLHCLRAVLAQAGVSVEVVLVDNCSTDETPQLLARLDNVRVLRNRENAGFLLAVNQAAAEARGRTILLLNSDAFVREDALAIALQTLESDDQIGAVGGRLILPSGQLQEAGSIVWSDASAQGYGRNLPREAGEVMFRRDVDFCSGAFLLTPRVLFEQMGRLDPVYAPAYYEEADYCLRLWQAGLRVVYEPGAVIDHYEFGSETRGGESISLMKRNRKHLRLRHTAALQLQHLPPSEGNVLFARNHIGARRRLLVIEHEVPLTALGSGYPRMRAMLNEAVAAGWFVTLYPLFLPTVNWEAAYAELSGEIEICDGRGVDGLEGFLAERMGYYDAILVSRPGNMAQFKEAVRNQPHVIAGSRLIYDAEAIFAARDILQAELEGRPMSAADANAVITQEIRLTADVDAVVTVSASEAQLLRERQAAPVHVLSHPTRPRRDAPGREGRAGFLFIGRLLEKTAPNYQGLTWFLRFVWPEIRTALEEVTLLVVGAVHPEPAELESPGVRLLGQVEDLGPLYDRARVFVSPIRFAAGVPIKILESGAAGLPVVGTKLMATLLGWRPGVEIEATDDPVEMARAAIALYGDGERWEEVRTAALRRLEREHSEEGFRRGLRGLLEGNDPFAARTSELDDTMKPHRIARERRPAAELTG
jgi:GT2 family glycosyltransferase